MSERCARPLSEATPLRRASWARLTIFGELVPKDYAEAAKWYRKAAEQGFAMAQHSLGSMYEIGQGFSQDYAEAVKWYRKAAEQGHAEAQFGLGYMYYHGQGVPQDYAEAVLWYRKAAEQGYDNAQNDLGRMYRHGQGVPQDYTEAVKWYRKAAEQAMPKHSLASASATLGAKESGRTTPRRICGSILLPHALPAQTMRAM